MSTGFCDVIDARRSVRAYTAAPVAEEKLQRIIDAVVKAPTAANRQPFKLYVVRSEAVRTALGKAYKQPWFYQAPVILVICTVPGQAWARGDGKNYADVDASIVFEHAILAATAEGLGTCWIGAFEPEGVRAALALPAGELPLAMTPVGYADEAPAPRKRRPVDELVVFK